jgi:hypothetical protein
MRIPPTHDSADPHGPRRGNKARPTRQVSHKHHEVRPGALTRPRRPRPTSGETPKARHVFDTAPSPLPRPASGPWLGDDSTVFLRMSFVRAEPALLRFHPSSDRAVLEEDTKTSPCWQCDTHGETLAGLGCRLLGFATLVADFDGICIDDGRLRLRVWRCGGWWHFVRDRWGWGRSVGWLRTNASSWVPWMKGGWLGRTTHRDPS